MIIFIAVIASIVMFVMKAVGVPALEEWSWLGTFTPLAVAIPVSYFIRRVCCAIAGIDD